MPSVAVLPKTPTPAAQASTGSSASGGAASARSAKDSTGFSKEVRSALGDDASPTSDRTQQDSRSARASDAPSDKHDKRDVGRDRGRTAKDTQTRSTQKTDQPAPAKADAGGADKPIDADTLAALIAAAEAQDSATGTTTTDGATAAGSTDPAEALAALLAQLGLKLDGNGKLVKTDGGSDGTDATGEGGDASPDATNTDLAAVLAAIAALAAQQQQQPATPAAGTGDAAAAAALAAGGAAAGDAATPDGAVLPQTGVPTAPTGDGTTDPQATQQAALPTVATATDATQRTAGRAAGPQTRAEERLRRITAEVARLDGSAATNSGLATLEVTGKLAPASATAGDGATSGQAQAVTLGSLLALAEQGADKPELAAKSRGGEPPAGFMLPQTGPQDPSALTASATATPAQQTALPSSPATLNTLAQTVAAHAAKQDSQFEIKLNPTELGKVNVSLNISSDGTVHAHLRVERPETLDMMLRDQSHLTRALEQSGLSVASGGLEFSLQQQGQGWGREASAPMPTGAAGADDGDDESVALEAVAATRLYSRAGPAGVDLSV